ncbi:MAG: cadherin-like domain-containing protein [Acidobacteria bacterium]|nr:cadherin-like domain-containing protein [Acidobacteriota bacterium]
MLAYLTFFAQLAPVPAQVSKVKRAPASATQSTQQPRKGGTITGTDKHVALPAPNIVTAPNIVATKTDSWDDSATPDGKAEPGQVVTYTVTITNNGTADANNVNFADSVDTNTTLVPGSVNTQPIAIADTYNVIGNVRIQPNAAQGLLANDRDPDTGNNTGLTASGPSTSTQGGNVTINADGSFSYNPAPGFAGTDTFTYTITDAGGKTDTAVATFNVGNGTATPGTNVVWFINPAAPSGGDGRLTSPFNCYTGVSASCFSQTAADDPGDAIFIFNGSVTGGYALLANEKLIGQGASDTLANIAGLTVPTASDALPTTNATPSGVTISTTNANAIPLPAGAGNAPLLRGFTVGNTGTGAKISGTTFGTLTVGNSTTPDVILNGTGQALNLSTGTFGATSGFASVATTSSAAQGINLAGITGSGTIGFGSTTVSTSTTQCILVGTTTYNINFGNTSVSTCTNGVELNNNSGGTRTFGTLTANTSISGLAFTHTGGGGNVTINGAATLSSTGDVVNIQNAANGTSINFVGGATVTKSSTGGNGVNWSGTNTGATLTFATLSLTTSNGTGMNLAGGGAVNVTTAAGSSISTTGVGAQVAPAINASGVAIGINLTTLASTNSGGTGTTLSSVTGSLTAGTTNMQNPTGIGINVTSSSATFNFGSTTVNGSGSTGISLGGSGTGNSGAITFGSLSVTPDSGQNGLVATQNTGAITSTSGTITTTSGTAVLINGTSSGSKTPLNMQLTTVNTTGSAVSSNGIFLKFTSATGSPGGFSVLGSGGTCTFASSGTCTGGRITNTSGADNSTGGIGVYLEDVASVSLTRMHIDNHPNFAIRGKTVNGFTFQTSVIDGNNGTSAAADVDIQVGEDAIKFSNLTGSALIDSSTVSGGFLHNIQVDNNTGTLNRLTVSNSFIGDPDAIGSGQRGLANSSGDDFQFEAKNGITTMNVTLSNNTFNFGFGRLVGIFNNSNTGATGNVDAVVRGNTLVNANPFASQAGASHVAELSGLGNMTYEVSCNKIANSLGIALLIFKGRQLTGSPGANFVGTIFNNTIGISGQNSSGGGFGTSAAALNIDQQGTGTGTVLIKNNVIRQYTEEGIRLNNVDNHSNDATGNFLGASTLNATVIGNTTTEPANVNAFAGIFVVAGAGASTDSFGVTNLKLGGAGAEANNFFDNNAATTDIFLQTPFGHFNLTKGQGSCTGTGACAASVAVANNPTGPPTVFADVNIVVVNTTPTLPPAINESCSPPPIANLGDDLTPPASADNATTQQPAPTQPASNDITSQPFVSLPQVIKPAKADASVAASVQPGALQQSQQSPQAPVSKTGGGSKSEKQTKPTTPVIQGSGGTVNVNIGTLAPNDSVTITFQVTIDDPYSGGANISNQGTVSGSNFSNVLTDDPDVAGTANPTLTPVNSTHVRVNDAKQSEPDTFPNTSTMLFVVTLSQPAPGGGLSVNYSTGGGTATGGASCDGTADYITATNATATVPAGSKIGTIPVTVCSDNVPGESDETLTLTVSSPSTGTLDNTTATGTITQGTNPPGTFLISELRESGPGAGTDADNNEFVELYNNSDSQVTVQASDASAGWGVFKSGASCTDLPVLVGTVQNGTVIPARGHYLLVGNKYSLASYAAGDVTMTADIENDRDVALFTTADPLAVSTAARKDGVGFASNAGVACDLMQEGTTLASTSGAGFDSEYSLARKLLTGLPQDANDNASDFMLVSTTPATTVGAGTPTLGAPGPENLTSPVNLGATIKASLIDPCTSSSAPPNRERNSTPNYVDPAPTTGSGTGTYSLGYLDIRRRFTNNTGANVTRLRFRVVDVTTITGSSEPAVGTADLRLLTSPVVNVTTSAACGSQNVAVRALTLEQPPTQPNGGGLNSTVTAGAFTLGTPLANGAVADVTFRLGVKQGGSFRFFVIVEAVQQ